MCHFPEDAAAGRSDTLDGGEGAVGVEGVFHGRSAGGVAVLGRDLAVGGELGDGLGGGEEFTLAVGDGDGMDFADGHVGEPGGGVRYDPGLDVLGDVAGDVVVDEGGGFGIRIDDATVSSEAGFDEGLEAVADAEDEAVTVL